MDTFMPCTNGGFIVCLVIGSVTGFIWSLVDPKFDSFVASRLLSLLGAVIGAAAGLVLDHFTGPWC